MSSSWLTLAGCLCFYMLSGLPIGQPVFVFVVLILLATYAVREHQARKLPAHPIKVETVEESHKSKTVLDIEPVADNKPSTHTKLVLIEPITIYETTGINEQILQDSKQTLDIKTGENYLVDSLQDFVDYDFSKSVSRKTKRKQKAHKIITSKKNLLKVIDSKDDEIFSLREMMNEKVVHVNGYQTGIGSMVDINSELQNRLTISQGKEHDLEQKIQEKDDCIKQLEAMLLTHEAAQKNATESSTQTDEFEVVIEPPSDPTRRQLSGVDTTVKQVFNAIFQIINNDDKEATSLLSVWTSALKEILVADFSKTAWDQTLPIPDADMEAKLARFTGTGIWSRMLPTIAVNICRPNGPFDSRSQAWQYLLETNEVCKPPRFGPPAAGSYATSGDFKPNEIINEYLDEEEKELFIETRNKHVYISSIKEGLWVIHIGGNQYLMFQWMPTEQCWYCESHGIGIITMRDEKGNEWLEILKGHLDDCIGPRVDDKAASTASGPNWRVTYDEALFIHDEIVKAERDKEALETWPELKELYGSDLPDTVEEYLQNLELGDRARKETREHGLVARSKWAEWKALYGNQFPADLETYLVNYYEHVLLKLRAAQQQSAQQSAQHHPTQQQSTEQQHTQQQHTGQQTPSARKTAPPQKSRFAEYFKGQK